MRSLRSALLVGLLGGGAALITGFSGVVYARAHSLAHEALRSEARFRADTLAGLLEIEPSGIEFEVPDDMLAPFQEPGRGAYLAIVDAADRVVVKSPSLRKSGGALPAPAPWEAGSESFDEVAGPGGEPCILLTRSFVARADGPDGPDEDEGAAEAPAALPGAEAAPPPARRWRVPPEHERRYRIQVALDSTARDRSLAELRGFLLTAGGIALLLTLVGSLLVAELVLRPVHRMTGEAAALTPENPDRRLRPDTVVGELHALAGTLNSAFDRLGAALLRQRQFTSDASHELRTPVSVLMANAEHLLRRPRSGEEYRAGLERQRRIAARMKEITENLLVLARGDITDQRVEPRPLRLDALARTVCREFEPLAEGAGLALRCEAGTAVAALGDALQVQRALANLVSNAVKFTPPGGRVDVRVSAGGGDAVVEVADTGPGVPREHAEAIFERFFRLRQGKDAAEGAGLGLAIVRSIVQAHGGSISVAPRDGGGSVFRVRFPAPPEGVGTPDADVGADADEANREGAGAVTAGAVPGAASRDTEG